MFLFKGKKISAKDIRFTQGYNYKLRQPYTCNAVIF